MNFKMAVPTYFFILFLVCTSAFASGLNPLSQVENAPLQNIVSTADEYFEFFSSTPGSCTNISLFAFERSRGLIKVARKAVYEANPGYDYPRDLTLRYLGVLNDSHESFVLSLEGLMGGRQQSFVRHYFERRDDQDALERYWLMRDTFQRQLGELSRDSRILVYRGHKENSFGRSDLVVLLDPELKQLALFQAGWCE